MMPKAVRRHLKQIMRDADHEPSVKRCDENYVELYCDKCGITIGIDPRANPRTHLDIIEDNIQQCVDL